ncbi:MAG: PH domain-containing protein [Muribaculaceae bacterium]|nr:PH domain-containing protein [Muribaculaceae bacterium]
MKSKVKLSAYCTAMTIGLIVLFIALAVTIGEKDAPAVYFSILVCIAATCLFYAPTSIEVTDHDVIIHRLLKDKSIPLAQITAADRCIPSAGGLRLCGSGGFFGYWGLFNDIIIGTYFGYYGDKDQCILLKLKGGKQYVISCDDPNAMLSEISNRLQ